MIVALAVASFLTGLVGCSKPSAKDTPFIPESYDEWFPGAERCEFFIGGSASEETKATSVTYSNESRINRWGMYIFASNGSYVTSAASSAGEGVQKFLHPGTYTVVALVNYPTSGTYAINPAVKGSINTLSSLYSALVPRLEDMALNSLMMYGVDTFTINEGSTLLKTVDVRRLVSKVGIKKISLDWTNPGHAAEDFTLKHIYLTNVFGVQQLSADIERSAMSTDKGNWFNAMGYHGSGSRTMTDAVESMTADRNINTVIADGSSVSTEHYFYAFPNACYQGEGVTSSSWSVRSTCMVIEATCGGQTYYYRIALPAMGRNKTYIADEVVINNLGSLDPNQDVANSMTVRFGFSTSWDQVEISENS